MIDFILFIYLLFYASHPTFQKSCTQFSFNTLKHIDPFNNSPSSKLHNYTKISWTFLSSLFSLKKKKKISLLIHYLNFQVTTRPATKSHAEQKIQYHFPTRIVRPPHGKRYEDTANPFKREERVNVGEQLSKRQNTLVHKGGIKHPASNHDLANRSRSIRFEGND